MPRITYEENIIASLGCIEGRHKLLYVTLWSRANCLGIVQIDFNQLFGLTGFQYELDDFNQFGNRVVFLNDKEVLLTRYMQITLGKLSRGMKGQKRVWEELEHRWGATKDDVSPLKKAWVALGVGIFSPIAIDEYTGEDNLPPRLIKYRNLLNTAKTVDTPHKWSDSIANEFKQYISKLVSVAMDQTSKSDTEKHRLCADDVITLQTIVQEMLDKGTSEEKIIQQIRASKIKTRHVIYTP